MSGETEGLWYSRNNTGCVPVLLHRLCNRRHTPYDIGHDFLRAQRGVRFGDEGLEVLLEPRPRLGRGLVRVRERARRVVAGRGRVGRAVGLAAGLDPHDRVDERAGRARRRARAEPGALDVAPVAPLVADVLHAGPALVDDELRGEARGGEHRPERLDVQQLVVVRVALRDRVRRRRLERVVVRDVWRAHGMSVALRGRAGGGREGARTGREAADERGRVRALEHLREELRGGLDVRGPAEPARVAGVHVHVRADRGELLERVRDARLVRRLGVRALRHVQVRDEVRERVGLDDRDGAHVRVLLDLRDDLVDVVEVLRLPAVRDAELAVGRLGGAVAVGEVVHDELDELLVAGAALERARVREVRAEVGHLRDTVEPGERGDVRDALCLCLQSGIGDVLNSGSNLCGVVGAEEDL